MHRYNVVLARGTPSSIRKEKHIWSKCSSTGFTNCETVENRTNKRWIIKSHDHRHLIHISSSNRMRNCDDFMGSCSYDILSQIASFSNCLKKLFITYLVLYFLIDNQLINIVPRTYVLYTSTILVLSVGTISQRKNMKLV